MSIQNPWQSILFDPRRTIRAIVEENPRKSLWILAFIYGFSSLLSGFQSFTKISQLQSPLIWILAFVLSPLIGYIRFFIASWIVLFTGRIFKGKAVFSEIRASYAWACVPLIGTALLWCAFLWAYGDVIFAQFDQQQAVLTSSQLTFLRVGMIGALGFEIWGIILFIQCLAEVQRFSTLRSIGNVVISWIVMAIFLLILGLLMQWVGSSFPQNSSVGGLVIYIK